MKGNLLVNRLCTLEIAQTGLGKSDGSSVSDLKSAALTLIEGRV